MRLRLMLCVVLLARVTAAQVPDTTRATVSGVVHDSIAQRPLAGAVVQLVAADSLSLGGTAVTDSLGRFTIANVPAGRYMLGFFHEMLDSLGLEPTLRAVSVGDQRPVRADLAIPSPARLRDAICRPRSVRDSAAAVVVGVVRDARGRAPIAGAAVTAEWMEFSFTTEGLERDVPRIVATTGENGWFALCNLPSVGTIALMTSRGADSTDRIEVDVPEHFLRRELYLGHARIVVTRDTSVRTDTMAPRSIRRTGDGRLSGRVVRAVGSGPVAGARVHIPGGPQTITNERGEWTLVDAPTGTRVLEVRAVGYYPEHRAVDVVADSPPIRTALSTMKAVLDTVQVRASRQSLKTRGFEQRRRSGMGRYLTPEDIERRQPRVTSDLFREVPGIRMVNTDTGTQIMMGAFAFRCAPAVYIDGLYMRGQSAEDIDTWAHPDEVAGIEVYSAGGAPPQFTRAFSGCGSILIWTRPRLLASRSSWKSSVVKVLGIALAAMAIDALVDRR